MKRLPDPAARSEQSDETEAGAGSTSGTDLSLYDRRKRLRGLYLEFGAQFRGRVEGNPQVPQCTGRTALAVRDALQLWLSERAAT